MKPEAQQFMISLRNANQIGGMNRAASMTNTPKKVIEQAIERDGYFLSEKYRVEPVAPTTFWNSEEHPDGHKNPDGTKRRPLMRPLRVISDKDT
jgi:hypothetical protein